ncbi:type 2 lantipeptide synthetase LanM [Lactococcus hircilactis]|uniref:Type 2 lantipeptide synthetase LanM n=1 Tax=Lactococcus hircilactis TaxID=1494462 RepID=A0A7X2CZP9_9LACT|nr:type 2 lanthipeptide synthetase LanM [Lactococcus hircilactis]MQW38348.1 type 2 lantipeptide synthetase LanM [Lactococcus hircilactis]
MSQNEYLKKISSRNNINEMLNGFHFNGVTERKYFGEVLYGTWKRIQHNEEIRLIDFYRAMVTLSTRSIITEITHNKDWVDSENLTKAIQDFFGTNISIMSDNIFKSEMRRLSLTEMEYFQLVAENYELLRDLSSKFSYWTYVMGLFLKGTEEFLLEFLNQLVEDRGTISVGLLGTYGKINVNNFSLQKGDVHNGKFVIEVETDCGNFFYKPRNTDVDEALKSFADFLQENNPSVLDLKFPKSINRKQYSWVEKIEYQKLGSASEEKRYYVRLGQLLAMMYILEGNDIHYENLISNGEYPVIIDAETVLTNRLFFVKSDSSKYLQENAINCMYNSVRSTAILPDFVKLKGEYYNISPLNFCADGIREVRKDKLHALKENMTSSEDNIVSFIKQGFLTVYLEIQNNSESYYNYLNKLFSHLSLRFLNKPTNNYESIKRLLFNPVCLLDIKYAFAVTSKVLKPNAEAYIDKVEQFEQKELLRLNIPQFMIEADSTDIIVEDGVKIPKYFIKSPLTLLKERIEILGPNDCKRQVKMIDWVFKLAANKFSVLELSDVKNLKNRDRIGVESDILTKYVSVIVKEIFDKRLINPVNETLFWTEPQLENQKYILTDLPNNYYAGNIGILKSLLSSKISEIEGFTKKLIEDIEKELSIIFESDISNMSLGAFTGLGMYFRYFVDLYEANIITKDILEKKSWALLDKIKSGISKDKKLDIIDGTAGLALSLIRVYSYIEDNFFRREVEETLDFCYKHLLQEAVMEDESFFPVEQSPKTYFTGFAHGSSGIVVALYKIGKILGRDEGEIVSQFLNSERRFYDNKLGVWYKDNGRTNYSWGWCHGIPGILLSRIELFNDGYRDEVLLQEINKLYEITLERSLGTNLTLCHGDLGNLIICSYVNSSLGRNNDIVLKLFQKQFQYYIEAKDKIIRGTETISLMNGLAGIGVCMSNYNNPCNLIDILKVV